ncbi:IS3 family transposase [Candidatus Poriferisocius sp.]|uniref:IS3 family transposase n=1 Tax=Candidatus Poriferisocius sp. TaxID=3101276 RepID=UPI003B5CD186
MARRLCFEERVRIEEMARAECSAAETARRLGRHPTTVQRELGRGGPGAYCAEAAQAGADARGRRPKVAKLADADLVGAIRAVHADSGGTHRSPRVTAQLRRQGRRVNRKRVEQLMRQNGIYGIHKRRKPRFKGSGSSGTAPEDLVRWRFRPGPPDRVWAGDITYIPTGQSWPRLAVVLDVGPRRLVGCSMADHA